MSVDMTGEDNSWELAREHGEFGTAMLGLRWTLKKSSLQDDNSVQGPHIKTQ